MFACVLALELMGTRPQAGSWGRHGRGPLGVGEGWTQAVRAGVTHLPAAQPPDAPEHQEEQEQGWDEGREVERVDIGDELWGW